MPRVHFVKKARKNNRDAGIKKGDSYYWWKFRFDGKHFSEKPPRPSQLTQSEYLSTVYSLQEQVEDMEVKDDNLQDVAEELRNVAVNLRDLGSEQEEKISNMPDSLQSSATADLLQSRADACEEVAGELENAAEEIEGLVDPEVDIDDPAAAGAEQAKIIIENIGWDYGD
jgi:flagellar biosynthesis chaperone FliJ